MSSKVLSTGRRRRRPRLRGPNGPPEHKQAPEVPSHRQRLTAFEPTPPAVTKTAPDHQFLHSFNFTDSIPRGCCRKNHADTDSPRFARLTNAFSMKAENHAHNAALHFIHYNYCRIHQTLRITLAMAADLTDHVFGRLGNWSR
jgi:hypothetical protein